MHHCLDMGLIHAAQKSSLHHEGENGRPGAADVVWDYAYVCLYYIKNPTLQCITESGPMMPQVIYFET